VLHIAVFHRYKKLSHNQYKLPRKQSEVMETIRMSPVRLSCDYSVSGSIGATISANYFLVDGEWFYSIPG